MDETTYDAETPGIEAKQGTDPTLITAAIFIAVGYTPASWWARLVGVSHFGPLELPAVLAMVGVLFAFITGLRGLDLQDRTRMRWAVILGALGMVRLFLLPFTT